MTGGGDAGALSDLTRSADFVFRGRVLETGSSAVRAIAARPELAVVDLLEELQVDPVLGDLTGQPITVELAPGSAVAAGEEAIFFTRHWLHGDNLAVREIAHVPVSGEAGHHVRAAVAAISDQHLQDRLHSADRVVVATVVHVAEVKGQSGRRQSPRWARARLAVEEVLKGPSAEHLDVYFPTGDDKRWRDCPRPSLHQRAVFVLRSGDPLAGEWLGAAGLPDNAPTALDAADVQPPGSRDQVMSMVSA